MSATCVVLANERGLLSTVEIADASRRFLDILVLAWSPLQGASIAGLLLWLGRRFSVRATRHTTPGHWMLVVLAVRYLVVQAREWTHVALGDELILSRPLWTIVAERGCIWLIQLGVAAVAAAYCWRHGWWRASFVTLAMIPVLWAAHMLLFWAMGRQPWFPDYWLWEMCGYVLYSLAALCAVAGLVSDRRNSVPRDFLHYAGAAVLVLHPLLAWPGWIIWRFVL